MDKDMRKMFKEAVRKSRQVSHPEDIMIQYELGPLTIPDWAYEPDPDTGEIDPNPAQWGTYDQGKFSGFTTKEEVPVGLRPIAQENKLILPNIDDEGQDYTNAKPSDSLAGDIQSGGGMPPNDFITIEKTENGYLIYPNTPHPMNNRVGKTIFRVSPQNSTKFTTTKRVRDKRGRPIKEVEKSQINHVNQFKLQLRTAIKKLSEHIETGSKERLTLVNREMRYYNFSDDEKVVHRLSVRTGKTGYKKYSGDHYIGIVAEVVIDNEKDYANIEDDYDLFINFFTCRAICHYAYMDVLADFFELDLPPTFRKKINAKPKPRAPSMTMASGETIPIHTKPAIQDKTLLDAEAFIKSMKR